jgi:hypothetical protein
MLGFPRSSGLSATLGIGDPGIHGNVVHADDRLRGMLQFIFGRSR